MRPGLEEEVVEKRKNVFVRIYDFLKSLFQRIAGWIEKRREKGRQEWRAKEGYEETKQSMDVEPSVVAEAKEKVKTFDAEKFKREVTGRQEDSAMKLMDSLVTEAQKFMTSKEFLQTHFAGMAKDYAGYYALRDGSSNDFLNKIVRLNSTFNACAARLEHAIDHTKNGRQQAVQLIDQLLEQVSGAIAESRELLEQFGKNENVDIPNIHSLLEAATDERLVGAVIAQFEGNGHDKVFERIEDHMEPLLAVFKQVAEADPSELSGVAASIQDIGVERLNALAQMPVYLMSISGRIDTLRTIIIPSSSIDIRRIAAKAVEVAAGGVNIAVINEAATFALLEIFKNRYK